MSIQVIGIFNHEEEVIQIIKDSVREGREETKYSVLAVDEEKAERIEQETRVSEQHVISEEAFGLISGFLTGISGGFIVPGLIMPGYGPLIAAGPLASRIEGNSEKDIKDMLLSLNIDEATSDKITAELQAGKIVLLYETEGNPNR